MESSESLGHRESGENRLVFHDDSTNWLISRANYLHSLHLELVLSKTRQQLARGLTILLSAIHSGFIEDS